MLSYVKLYEVPFFVALDHVHKAVVVSVRGTLSLEVLLSHCSLMQLLLIVNALVQPAQFAITINSNVCPHIRVPN